MARKTGWDAWALLEQAAAEWERYEQAMRETRANRRPPPTPEQSGEAND